MRATIALMRLNHELAIWRRAWHVPVMWWRDDDAREPTWQLDRLLDVRRDLPLMLAVIPDVDLHPLANRLGAAPDVDVAQHGIDHANKLAPGGPRSEFLAGATQAEINAAVAAGRARLVAAGLPPVTFVPPWNEPSDR
ncbi:MAG: polysaccharide deacetylase, partial [Burkholderiales bacterium]